MPHVRYEWESAFGVWEPEAESHEQGIQKRKLSQALTLNSMAWNAEVRPMRMTSFSSRPYHTCPIGPTTAPPNAAVSPTRRRSRGSRLLGASMRCASAVHEEFRVCAHASGGASKGRNAH